MSAMVKPIVASDPVVRRAAEQEFDSLTASYRGVRRNPADTEREMATHRAAMDARHQSVKDWARPIVDAGTYSHRDALLLDLIHQRTAVLETLTTSELALLKICAIELWPDHARAHGLDVRAIAAPRPALTGGLD